MRAALNNGIAQVLRFIPPPVPEWIMLAALVCVGARGCT
jgi:hypothetical protein